MSAPQPPYGHTASRRSYHRRIWRVCVAVAIGLSMATAACQGRLREPQAKLESLKSQPSRRIKSPLSVALPHVAHVDLSDGLPELAAQGVLSPPKPRTFAHLIRWLKRVENGQESPVRGLMISFGATPLAFAQMQELAGSLSRIKAKGLSIACHAHDWNNSSYGLAAAACDPIWVSPAGGVDTVGIAAQVVYGRRLLEQLKVDVDMLQVGKYKGANEPFTRDGPSDEARESMRQTLGSIREQWIEGMAQVRPTVTTLVENGPYSPQEAKALGLVDKVGLLSDALTELRSTAHVSQAIRRFGPGATEVDMSAMVDLVRLLSGASTSSTASHVALVRAVGAITLEDSPSLFSAEEGISHQTLSRTLVELQRDDAVKAVVLRLDSPGGSALASDLIWRQMMELRAVKPLVVSIGSMAASGGYYLACAGSKVFAQPSSIVGSIGVVGGKLSFSRSMDHVGLTAETIAAVDTPQAKNRAAYLSPFAAWDEATRERVERSMRSVYDLFVARIEEARHLPTSQVTAFAEGRLFAGREALGLGMVDTLGGLHDAIDYALTATSLAPEAVRLVEPDTGLRKLFQLDEPDDDIDISHGMSHRQSTGWGASAGSWMVRSALESSGFLSTPKDWLRVAASYEPWLHGERSVVAVPYVFLVR